MDKRVPVQCLIWPRQKAVVYPHSHYLPCSVADTAKKSVFSMYLGNVSKLVLFVLFVILYGLK